MTPIHFSGLVFILGAYGSGKSEISVQLAALCAQKGVQVQLVDMDLVNPYFRTREARTVLFDLGVNVILPDKEYVNADLPVVSPNVLGVLRKPGELTIVDVGGDPAGATPVASFKDVITDIKPEALMVINPYRPFTATVENVLRMRMLLETASGVKITGLIANPNLLDDTTIETILEGAKTIDRMAEALQLTCWFIAVSETFRKDIAEDTFSYPVVWLKRHLVPPWLRPGKLDERI